MRLLYKSVAQVSESKLHESIQQAFDRLASRNGFVERPDQRQLALLVSDCLEGSASGLFEAPTGLGKSLAALIPAVASALESGRRTIIATYTNVLAEQYWNQDLPLALSLFDHVPKCQYLVGKQQYVCLSALFEKVPASARKMLLEAERGTESDFRALGGLSSKDARKVWPEINVPRVCAGRLCPRYSDCFYFRARKGAEKAHLVITNHSMVLEDAILKHFSDGDMSLLGEYDVVILDEAHDFPQAAHSSFEFEMSARTLGVISGLSGKLEQALMSEADRQGDTLDWVHASETLRLKLAEGGESLQKLSSGFQRSAVLAATPDEVWKSPAVQVAAAPGKIETVQDISKSVAHSVSGYGHQVRKLIRTWDKTGETDEDSDDPISQAGPAADTARNYLMFLDEYAQDCGRLLDPAGVAVTYAEPNLDGVSIRKATVDLVQPLRDFLWDQVPWIGMSATLALDGAFDHFKRITGAEPQFEEILPSPFDFSVQAALYLPRSGAIPDPSLARKEGTEEQYFDAIARELHDLIGLVGGRTLALFHSRREMEAVYARMAPVPELPLYIQSRTGASSVGDKFKDHVHSSLFALRSFWTGFDAPGETCSCVAIVRVPFEVPVDPPQIARNAWLATQGLDGFKAHSLPNAKMMIRQGVGRLIRRAEDRGIIAILDPRLRTKRYGEEILANLPAGMRTFEDATDAVGWVGIGGL